MGSRARKGDLWVSKTDVTSFLRCPYAWYQVDQGLISHEEIIGPLEGKLLDDGNAFHGRVESMALPVPKEAGLSELFATDAKLLGLPILENEGLMILGAPDGVDAAAGALLPVEIKSHKDVRRSDELELAFYWMLLEPYRTRQVDEPSGILVLRRDGQPVQVDVSINPSRFEQVETLLGEIRKVRRKGVRPRVCGCAACSGPLRKRINRMTRKGRDLTLLFDVSRSRVEAFEAVGIKNYEELAACDGQSLRKRLHYAGTYLSLAQIEQMCFHARSYQEARPILFGKPPPAEDAFIALDLEYNTLSKPNLVWLVGLMVVEGDEKEHLAFWADGPEDERRNLERLAEQLIEKPSLPVLTWSGTSADLPALRKANLRLGIESLLADIEARHVDLFEHARRSLRLPIPQLGLAEVAAFFGIPKTSAVSGGFEAQQMYNSFQLSSDAEQRAKLKRELTAYNRDDLEALAETLRSVQALPLEPALAVALKPEPDEPITQPVG
jgi:predicted RecB family nuclease